MELPDIWAELINTSAYILNCTGSSVEDKPPSELWYSKKLQTTHLRNWLYCLCSCSTSATEEDGTDLKAEKGILTGHEGDDDYRIFVQPCNTTCRSRGITFDEKVITTVKSNCTVNINSDIQNLKSEKHEENKLKRKKLLITVTC